MAENASKLITPLLILLALVSPLLAQSESIPPEIRNEGLATVVELTLDGMKSMEATRQGAALIIQLTTDSFPSPAREFTGTGFIDTVTLRPLNDGGELRVLLWPGDYFYTAEHSGETGLLRIEVRDSYGSDPAALTPDSNLDKLRIRRIVIDPGHGGRYTGTGSYSGLWLEKQLVLPISYYLANLLEYHLGLEVLLTRSTDTKIGLHGRTLLANRAEADLFISIHLNGHSNNHAHGAETFFLADAETSDSRALAHLENADFSVDPDLPSSSTDELAFILGSLMQNEYLTESQQLATFVQESMIYNLGCYNRGVKQAPFYVLVGTQMPAILVEVGFLTNEAEEQLLIDPSYQHEAAYAIYRGVAEYKATFESGLLR